MKKLFAFFAICLFSLPTALPQEKADRILGVYSVIELDTKEESKVKIFKGEDGKYYGQVIWLKKPNFPDGTPKRDIKNPDPKLRNTPGDKILLMKGFSYDPAKEEWKDGTIYDPVHGKTYSCYLKFESDTKLKVRGYIGIPALGKSMYWNKLQ